ncbi:glycosyl transferase [Micrococcus sp. NPDC055215]
MTGGGRRRVLYYAHQHGSGHVRHAANLAGTGAFSVTVVTAHPAAGDMLPAGTRLVPLPTDLVDGHVQPARSPLHHTPAGPVIRARFAALLAAAQEAEPDVCVVDVSVEAALFLRLAGYPVIHRRMHGDRTDPAHELVYAEADRLIAHYGVTLEDPAWQAVHGARTTHLGVPDVTGRLGAAAATTGAARPRVGVITGTGGGGVSTAALARAAAAVPHATWDVYGPVAGVEATAARPAADGEAGAGEPADVARAAGLPGNVRLHGWAPDVPVRAAEADVVVVSAGHNASVDAARSGRPVVLAPEPRPFAEQLFFARAAERAAGVPWCGWEDPDADWSGAVERALADPSAADRLAAALLVDPAEYRRRWEDAVEAALA